MSNENYEEDEFESSVDEELERDEIDQSSLSESDKDKLKKVRASRSNLASGNFSLSMNDGHENRHFTIL
jgi:hypothetical protein